MLFEGKGNLKANFSLNERKSKLNRSLRELVFSTGGVSGGDGERNDEFAYFLLFMDSVGAANYVKFLLDVMNFERLLLASANSSTIDQHALNIAIDIFSKYISKEAVYSIGLDDQLISATISIYLLLTNNNETKKTNRLIEHLSNAS